MDFHNRRKVSLLGPLVADNRPRRDVQAYEIDSQI